MSAAFTKLGVRYRFFKTHPNQYGDGKVHLQYWSREFKQWALLCRSSSSHGYFGTDLEKAADLTCKSCIKRDPRMTS